MYIGMKPPKNFTIETTDISKATGRIGNMFVGSTSMPIDTKNMPEKTSLYDLTYIETVEECLVEAIINPAKNAPI
jgi:hypothetical protein